jgi:hypothetical protein
MSENRDLRELLFESEVYKEFMKNVKKYLKNPIAFFQLIIDKTNWKGENLLVTMNLILSFFGLAFKKMNNLNIFYDFLLTFVEKSKIR